MMNVAMILGLFPAFMAMIAVYYILKAIGLSEGSMIRVALVLVYTIIGLLNGIVILVNTCHLVAPSINAASSIVLGIVSKKPLAI